MLESILIAMHTGSNTGYAIAPLERAFLGMARRLVGGDSRIHFAYRDLDRGAPETLPQGFRNFTALDYRSPRNSDIRSLCDYVARNGINTVFAFDAPVSMKSYRPMRQAGVRWILSYQGAPMSSLNSGPRLLFKRLETRLKRARPDHFIFESEAMRSTAVRGRGVPDRDTSVVYLGIDPDRFQPAPNGYAHEVFHIPKDRTLVVYSGHMEERKGVHVLVRALVALVDRQARGDVHLLVLGDQPGQADRFRSIYEGTGAENHITFGGYRKDIPAIFGSADIGAIASTGWDSFTMSAVEMSASGLPLVVSRLQGLVETVEDGITGLTFDPGDPDALAAAIVHLVDRPHLRRQMGAAGRERIIARHHIDKQVSDLASVVQRVTSQNRPSHRDEGALQRQARKHSSSTRRVSQP